MTLTGRHRTAALRRVVVHPPRRGGTVTDLAMVWSGLTIRLRYMRLDSMTRLGQDQTSLIPVHFRITCIWFFLFLRGSLASSAPLVSSVLVFPFYGRFQELLIRTYVG